MNVNLGEREKIVKLKNIEKRMNVDLVGCLVMVVKKINVVYS